MLNIDEIAHKKGRGNFMTLVSACNVVLVGFIGKKSEDLSNELKKIPGIENIKKVCIDMCSSFRKGILLAIPDAEIIADRFHIIKKMDERLWELNSKSYKKLDEEKRKKYSGIRFLLSKDDRKLTKSEKMIVKNYFKLNTEIKEIYDLVQEFRRILFNYHGFKRSFVSDKLADWTNRAMKYFCKFIKTLESWWDEVVNACIFKENNGKQEGINNEIKLIKRRGFGYRNYSNFKYRIFAQCNHNAFSQNSM